MEPSLQRSPCDDPAPLIKPAVDTSDLITDAYIVAYNKDMLNPDEMTAELAVRYGFTATSRWDGELLKGFAAILTPATVGSLRCEATVSSITQQYVIRVWGAAG